MRYINLHLTYVLTYLLTYLLTCGGQRKQLTKEKCGKWNVKAWTT